MKQVSSPKKEEQNAKNDDDNGPNKNSVLKGHETYILDMLGKNYSDMH